MIVQFKYSGEFSSLLAEKDQNQHRPTGKKIEITNLTTGAKSKAQVDRRSKPVKGPRSFSQLVGKREKAQLGEVTYSLPEIPTDKGGKLAIASICLGAHLDVEARADTLEEFANGLVDLSGEVVVLAIWNDD
jgi:hypothetical protein